MPGKNIRLLAGYPLIAYSIAASIIAKKIDRTVVSTDSEEIAEISRRYGAEVPFLRPAQLATDKSPDIEFFLHALKWFSENESLMPEFLVHIRPTTPLRDPELIDGAINMIADKPEATSLRSGHPASESPFKWFLMNEQGYFGGLRPQDSNDYLNLPRQDFPTVYIPDGYVDIIRVSHLVETKTLHGQRMVGFVSPVCREVDSLEELEYLEYEIKKKGSHVFDYLTANYKKG